MFIDLEVVKKSDILAICEDLENTGIVPYRLPIRPGLTKKRIAENFVRSIEKCYDIGKLDEIPDHVYDYYIRIVKSDLPIDDDITDPPEKKENDKKPAEIREPKKADQEVKEPDSPQPMELTPSAKRNRGRLKKDDSEDQPKRKRGRPKKQLVAQETKLAVPTEDQPKRKRGRPKKQLVAASSGGNEAGEAAIPTQATGRTIKRDKEQRTAPKDRPNSRFSSKGRGIGLNGDKITRAKIYCDIITDGIPRSKQEIVDEMMRRYGGSKKEAPFWIGGYCNLLIALGKMEKIDGKFVYHRDK